MDDDALDRVIDDAARQLTASEPRAGFRVRVMAAIERPQRPLFKPVVAGLAAAALIVLAVVVSRDRGRSSSEDRRSMTVPTKSAPQVRREQSPAATPEEVRAKADTTHTVQTRSTRATTAKMEDDAFVNTVDSLTPARLDVESIAVAALPSVEPIEPQQLQPVTSIAVAPLGLDDRGDPR